MDRGEDYEQKESNYLYENCHQTTNELGNSISSQLDLLRKYAEENNIEVVKEYQEIGSAGNENRYRFEKLLLYLKENNITDILVYSIDRLTRNIKDIATIKESNITVHLVKDNLYIYPFSNKEGIDANLIKAMKIFNAEREISNDELEEYEKLETSGKFYEADEFIAG